MGHIVKKILGDVNKDPEYKNLTIEYNADGMAHIHLGPIRLDLVKSAYNQLYDGVMEAQKKMSESHGWTQITKTYENKWGTKYFEILNHGEELFFVPVHKGLRWGALSQEKKNEAQEYSLKDNKIIEIKNSLTEVDNHLGVLTKFYPDWVPLVVLDVCDFYANEVFQKHKAEYHSKLSNYEFIKNLYNQIIDEYQKFYDATGLYFSDISANNVLMSPNFSDFRIIDIECIDVLRGDVEIPPHRILCGHFPPNRSDSKLQGPVGRSAEFLNVDVSQNDSWPNNLPTSIKTLIDQISTRTLKVNK
tara:strand:+ start:297 stop:1205 length:909 start_codon:yes stop_codon:yes gene_type:complete